MDLISSTRDLQLLRERARSQGERIRLYREQIEQRRRDLWARLDRIRADLDAVAPRTGSRRLAADPPSWSPAAALPAEDAGSAESPRPERLREPEAIGAGTERTGDPQEADEEEEVGREWLREEAVTMLRDGWTLQELADIGFGRDLLADVGVDLADGDGPGRDVRADAP